MYVNLALFVGAYVTLFHDKLAKLANQGFSFDVNNMKSHPKKTDFILYDSPTKVELCGSDNDIMKVSNIILSPDPPQKGQNFSLQVVGDLLETITDASLVAKLAKGPFKFPQMKMSACEYIVGGCPIEAGEVTLEMIFEIPKVLPGGSYDIVASLMSKPPTNRKSLPTKYEFLENYIDESENLVTCLSGTVTF